MLPIVIFVVFMVLLVTGSLVANALGRLPSAEELQAQDQARLARLEAER